MTTREGGSESGWKAIVRRRTPQPLRSFLVRLGRLLDREGGRFPSQEGAFRTLRSLGWAPRTCIDVGAYHGDWARQFRAIFPEARVLMVEAQAGQEARLQSAVAAAPQHLAYEIALLGAEDGREVEFVEMETGSSVFEESSPYPRQRSFKRLTTLDTLLKRHPEFHAAQALKLDTQGYELEVLAGAGDLLSRVEAVLLEVSLLAINRGAPSFAEVVAFMQARGFGLFDFCSQIRRRDGVLWQTDLLFVRGDAIPGLDARLTEENWG